MEVCFVTQVQHVCLGRMPRRRGFGGCSTKLYTNLLFYRGTRGGLRIWNLCGTARITTKCPHLSEVICSNLLIHRLGTPFPVGHQHTSMVEEELCNCPYAILCSHAAKFSGHLQDLY